MFRLGRVTALQKPGGGVRGIVVGDVLRRVLARTIAKAVEKATAPFQFALKTRAGSECVSHILQTLTDLDARATILSVDGVGAFDLISRNSMMEGLLHMEGGDQLLPCEDVLQQSIQIPEEDEVGTVHPIHLGEGGKQGDPLIPLLFALGQRSSFVTIFNRLQPCERVVRSSG